MATSVGGGPSNISSVRVVVVGDPGTGKSSLIVSVATDSFATAVPPVLPPTRLPADFYPDRIPLNIIDTSSRPEDKGKLDAECRKADAIMLTYACDRPDALDRLSMYWLPELRQLGVRVPIIVVGCKLDLRNDHQESLDKLMTPIMQEFREIETCIECSALKQIQVAEVFYYAQKAVLHPTAPLFDQESQKLKPHCIRALKRIFLLCDHDRDDALNDEELNDFQIKCFNAPLKPSEVAGVKRVVAEKLPEGVNDHGMTLDGFLFLHALFIERGRLETTWTVLRKFGYDDELKLRDDMLQSPSFKRFIDQNVELTDKAMDFLRAAFSAHDYDRDGALSEQEAENLFSTAPSNPWEDVIYKDSAEKNSRGGLTLNGFLAQWALMTLLDPVKSLAHLMYLNYPGDISTAFHISRRRRIDRKKQSTQRNVTNCFVFGPDNSGKTALIRSLVGRAYVEAYEHTQEEQYSAQIVESFMGTVKTLILREIPFDSISSLLADKNFLGPCDVALFMYDSHDELSWKQTSDLLLEVATHGENTGFEVPCLLVAAKDDLGPDTSAVSDSARVCQDLGMEAPLAVSVKLGDTGNIYRRLVDAAQRPHLSIPVTEAGKNYQLYRQMVNRSITIISVGAVVAIAGVAAYRVYYAKRQTSN